MYRLHAVAERQCSFALLSSALLASQVKKKGVLKPSKHAYIYLYTPKNCNFLQLHPTPMLTDGRQLHRNFRVIHDNAESWGKGHMHHAVPKMSNRSRN